MEGFIAKIPFLELRGSFEDALSGMQHMKADKVDVLFLDIQMEQLTGIQLLEALSVKPYVIITTAYADYALKGYELRVFDYLLKPYSFERFLDAVNKAYDDALAKQMSPDTAANIFVKTEYRLENIQVEDILWIEGMKEYLQIVTPYKRIMTKQSFATMLGQLPSNKFVQVHKSWVVAKTKIESIERNRIKIKDNMIPIGDAFRDNFYAFISHSGH
ncbi:LytTR family DNA-binding domain-containing protein [uncultured Acetobacteroides sp.]|uniref:LytR/AlgR family response regulator transcription factor n=1 Tax=uncultured Acetobacteroides sp. TaxID=1760811 RepID=UPI0029F48BE9|nr:LytTR family DNA-binding domain-containing protein [uncultured Acetobacteroides sp.]